MASLLDRDVAEINDNKGFVTFITAVFFVVTITALLMVILSLAYSDSYASSSNVSGIADPEYTFAGTILVTASVEESLGVKTLSNDFGRIVYLIYGNFRKGFAVISNETDADVYRYDIMPGDGVQVDLDNSENYKIVPNY